MDYTRLPILLLISSGLVLLPIAAKADLLFYEPFDYAPNSALAGLMPSLGAGGPWVDNSSGTGSNGSGQAMTVRANGTTGAGSGQTWPGIPSASTFVNSGGYLEGERRNDNSGHIPLGPEVTAKFTDGSTIWLSFVSASTTVNGLPDNHHKPNVAIGQGELLDDRAQVAAGEAVGGGVAHNTGMVLRGRDTGTTRTRVAYSRTFSEIPFPASDPSNSSSPRSNLVRLPKGSRPQFLTSIH